MDNLTKNIFNAIFALLLFSICAGSTLFILNNIALGAFTYIIAISVILVVAGISNLIYKPLMEKITNEK